MSADPKDVVMAQQREEIERLKKQLEGSVSKELAMSVLKGAAAELELAKTAVQKVGEEIGESLMAIRAQLAKLNPPT